ncbi:MAG: DUF6143 family protein [Negativicutes bacterium]|nr:DUF6143 family protein [Negativicutes bacterium]
MGQLAEKVQDDRCEAPPYMINITDPVFQSMQGNYFLGQTRLLVFGDGSHTWGALVNPPDSQVNLSIDNFSVSNYSTYPFVAQIWFNGMVQCPFVLSDKVSAANTALQPVPKPRVQLQFAESVAVRPAGGVNPLNQIVSPRSTVVDDKGGKFILPPGGSFLIFLVPPGACMVRARIGFGWWETQVC